MEVRSFGDPRYFAREAAGYFTEDPFSTSVIAVVVDGTLTSLRPQGSTDTWWTVTDGDRVVGAAMLTPPQKLFLSRMPAPAVVALAEVLAAAGRALPGVSGESTAVRAFAEAWQTLTGEPSKVAVSMRMYRLARLEPPDGVPGAPAPASGGDVGLVAGWLDAFHEEAHPQAPGEDWASVARRRIGAGQFRLWRHGEVVAMAAFTAPAAGVARIGPVYTPPHRRGQGFGSAVTSDATAAALASGADHVALYTDLANPTSNAIYQAIGYRVDHDAEERSFEAPGPLRPARS